MIEIKSRLDHGMILYKGEGNIKEVLEKAVAEGANLIYADISGADLFDAHLCDARLRGADLRGCNLRDAALCNCALENANLEDADLDGACLHGANLGGAKLHGIKNYSESHEIFYELVRRQKVEAFSNQEWVAIGQIAIHQLDWDSIKKRFGKSMLNVFEVLAEAGWGEYLKEYKKSAKQRKGKRSG